MKFETQTLNIIVNLKISKPEVTNKIQDGRCHHLEFHVICCHFVANCPISTKFCRVVQEKVSQAKNPKPDVPAPATGTGPVAIRTAGGPGSIAERPAAQGAETL